MGVRPLGDADTADPTVAKTTTNPPSNGRIVRSLVPLIVLLCTWLAGGGASSRAQSTDEEYRVKAAFLFHFAQLVDWPEDTLPGTDNSLFLCTLGEDPFQGALEGTVAGKAIGSRAIRVRHVTQTQEMQACQILFLGERQRKQIPTLLANLRNAPVLTVGETAGFLGAGGMICFLLEKNKVRFEINLNAAGAARLKIGSRLLVLAQNVVGERSEK
jgi:YfiR/HmsC-like